MLLETRPDPLKNDNVKLGEQPDFGEKGCKALIEEFERWPEEVRKNYIHDHPSG